MWYRLLLALWSFLSVQAVVRLESAQEFYEGIQAGRFDIIIDTRDASEWTSTGHIVNATFLEALQRFSATDPSGQVATPQDLYGCRYECTIAVYCSTGNRAQGAAEVLEAAGFSAPVYNALGVSQWVAAGYDLVNTESLNPACNQTEGEPRSCQTGEVRPANSSVGAYTSGASVKTVAISTTFVFFLTILCY